MLLRASTVVIAVLGLAPQSSPAVAPAAANAAFDLYVRTVESRLAAQHASVNNFLALPAPASARQLQTAPLIQNFPTPELPGALLHHWRATQFVPGATAAQLEHLLQSFSAYPGLFAPEVERANSIAESPGRFHATMRVRQRHVITVVLDTSYDVAFAQLDPRHRSSISWAARQIRVEMDAPGTRAERALPQDEDHGFLWRQNTYWSYEERDGGLYIQIESISLTRAVPTGLGWAIGPYIESIPRDSLEFTLSCIRRTLLQQHKSTAP